MDNNLVDHLKTEARRNQRLAGKANTVSRKRTFKYRAINMQRAIALIESQAAEISRLQAVVAAAQGFVGSEDKSGRFSAEQQWILEDALAALANLPTKEETQ